MSADPRTAAPGRLLLALAVLLALLGAVVNVWRPTAPPSLGASTELATFAPSVLERIEAYRATQRWAGLASVVLHAAVPAVLLAVPRTRRVLVRLSRGRRPWLRATGVVALVLVVTSLVTTPLDLWLGWVHERAWGFASGSAALWLRDRAVSLAITLAVSAVGVAGLLWLVRRAPATWDRWLVLLATAAAGLLVTLQPLVVQPLFLSTEPLPPGPTREAVAEVLTEAGEAGLGIDVGDASTRTTRVNAFVTGLGPSRRVVLYDNLLELPPEQVAYVVAHELAHREHRDITRGVLLTATAALPVAWLIRKVWRTPWARRELAADESNAMLPVTAVAVLLVLTLAGSPLANAISRQAEAAADHRALELIDDPEAPIALYRTFVTRDLADPTPPWWVTALWGTHPPVSQRIAAVVEHAEREGLELPSRRAGG